MFKVVYDALIESGFRIIAIDEINGFIRAKAKMSLRSWGEQILVHVLRTPQGVQVMMSSDASYQLVDWGKSKENIKKFFSVLNYKIMNIK